MDTLIIFGAKYLFTFVILGTAIAFLKTPIELRKNFLITAIVATVLAVAITKTAGALYFDPRPFTHGVHALFPHDADNGFPSDHTVLSVTAAAIAFIYSRKIGVALFGLALVVGLCRVLSGIHSPLDILAGIAFGVVSSLVAFQISKAMEKKPDNKVA